MIGYGKATISENVDSGYTSENKEKVIAVLPHAFCRKCKFQDGAVHYQIFYEDVPKSWIGFSTKSQGMAWENAWNVISKKMIRKLEW